MNLIYDLLVSKFCFSKGSTCVPLHCGREPLTGQPCRETDLRANVALRSVIVWMREQGIIADDDDAAGTGRSSTQW